jgi:hypothetical protein
MRPSLVAAGHRQGPDHNRARESAVGFYVACGARVLGAPYVDEVTGLIDRRAVFTV